MKENMVKVKENVWELPKEYKKEMKVPGRVYLNDELFENMEDDVLEQVSNVACLPGIQKYSLAMPDAHYGYGFCIGGVAAFDEKTGVISPGGVGFDISCLTPNSKILTEDKYFIKLEDLKEKLDLCLKVYNIEESKEKHSNVLFVSERDAEEDIIKIKTEFGRVLEGSADHPVLTPNGYVPMGMLEEGHDIIVYPFEGVEYGEPSDDIILDEKDFAEYDAQIVKYLKERGLLPLKMNHKQIGAIARLLGFALGDGSIVQENGDRKRLYVAYYGKKETLIKIKEDLEKLGVKSSKIYSRNRDIKIKNAWGSEYISSCEDNYIKIASKAFALFMHKLGMPIGKKINQIPKVPDWIKESPKWVKANFLAGLFGADGSKPISRTKNDKYAISPISLTISKTNDIENELINYLDELVYMLKEFDINAKIYKVKEYDEKIMYRLYMSSDNKELYNFLSKIGYVYCNDEKILIITEYLRRKLIIWENIDKEGISKVEQNKTFANNFETLEEFIKKYGVKGGFIIDKIKEIEKIPYNSKLYDVGIASKEHNFIANGIVVHNCGVRLLKTNLTKEDVQPKIKELVHKLFKNIPSGLGSKGKIRITKNEIDDVLEEGVKWAIDNNYGWDEDTKYIEENGCMKEADASFVSDNAKKRGLPQLGSLGSGNHFLEIQYVDEVFDEEAAKVYGIEKNQVVIMIHTGSRGLGHQICSDYLRYMEKAARKYNIKLPDRQLACAPINSEEGIRYFKAMNCGANYAWTNRQLITHWVRESFEEVFKTPAEDLEMNILYDVAHNIAKREKHKIDGKLKNVMVHRKGATRAFGPGCEDIPEEYRKIGQPVIIPGDMGTASYLMHGTTTAMEETFGSTAHGAGRALSRAKALKLYDSNNIKAELERKGIYIMADSKGVIAEECSEAYKSIELVADVAHNSGISLKVSRMKPMGVVKG
ncbi:RtcB family protein [Methanothermococcus sp. Ax23]|uniref:RtcB family protein n=1 Tax=Methanothermococcus sp. Ax23 TaxID=3156486 RepID=UPI003BA1A9D7